MSSKNLPSNRKFGWFFSIIFLLIGLYFIWNGAIKLFGVIFFLIAVIFAFISIISPDLLSLFNRLWYKFGLFLGSIVSPIVLAIIFFALLTPIALIIKAMGRDYLKLKKKSVNSYWVERSPPGPSSDSFKNQY